jgi:hypothetical protein
MEEGGQALKVNKWRREKTQKRCWLKEEEGVFIGGKKSGRWKQPAGQLGCKSGGAGL